MEKDMILTYRGVDITSKTALCTCRQCLEPTLTEIDNMLAVPPPKPICYFIGNCVNKNTGYGKQGNCSGSDVLSNNCKHRDEKNKGSV